MAEQAQELQSACILSVEVLPGRPTVRAAEAEAEPDEIAGANEDDAEAIEDDAEAIEDDAEEIAEEDARPTEVDAGAELMLVGTIQCAPARDLRELALLISDDEGSPLGEARITEFDGETNTTAELVLKAPLRPGEHTWLAVLPAHSAEEVDYDEVSTPFQFIVKAHLTSIVVWDVPTAIVAGESFRFKLGVKCSSECAPAGWTFVVSDENGQAMATGKLGDKPWPGTAALYCADVEARAPQAEGLHDWTVTAPGPGLDVPHEQHTARLGVRSVRRPEFLISVEAIDEASRAPIKGAKVVVHPYRVFTDAQGRAQVRVPKGTYRIFVSGPKHVPYRADSKVTADTTIRAELIEDREPSTAELWA